MKYKHTVYSTGYSLKVTPEDRGVDVMHHIITGGLLGGRSLDGVEWEKVELTGSLKKRGEMLRKITMRQDNEGISDD